jgi:hypothetical protein
MKLLSIVSKRAKKSRMSGRSFDKKVKSNDNTKVNNEKLNKKPEKALTKTSEPTNTLKESLFCYDNYGYGNFICNEKDECIVSNNLKSSSCQCKCNCGSMEVKETMNNDKKINLHH